MSYKVNDVLMVKNYKYIIIDSTVYGGIDYYLLNELTDDENPTQSFKVMEVKEGKSIFLNNEEKVNILLGVFEKNAKDIINDLK